MAFSRFHNLLRERVQKAIIEYSDSIIGGQAKDFADYRDACGYIRGLNDALRLCEDIEGDLNK
jgi:hypothetical protein